MRVSFLAAGLSASVAVVAVTSADAPPWWPRRRAGMRPNHLATARVQPEDWPAEPQSPSEVDPAEYARALETLCGWMRPGRPAQYAAWILRYAQEFGEDPFLLGALIYRQTLGSCRSDEEGPHGGLGLTAIVRGMYAETFRRGVYRYKVKGADGWREKSRAWGRFPFAGPRLKRPEENLYFAAALLSAWRDQHTTVDEHFVQVPHRHHVSHFFWGDRVRSDRDEDRVLTDRRRLLTYYGAWKTRPVERKGILFGSPLDGAPRVVSSGLGSEREGGVRSHRGIDLESLPSEPVRAIADGRVVFAGVDLPGRSAHEIVKVGEYDAYPRRGLGSGGRFVCIRHPRSGRTALRSCYMHLEEIVVDARTEVRRGQQIGTVGRTGMRRSAAHLHLELHGPSGVLDPADVLRGLVIGDPTATPARPR